MYILVHVHLYNLNVLYMCYRSLSDSVVYLLTILVADLTRFVLLLAGVELLPEDGEMRLVGCQTQHDEVS